MARTPRLSAPRTRAHLQLAPGLSRWLLAALLLWNPDDFLAFATAPFTAATVLLAPPITVGLMVDARHHKRTGGQLRLGPTRSASG